MKNHATGQKSGKSETDEQTGMLLQLEHSVLSIRNTVKHLIYFRQPRIIYN